MNTYNLDQVNRWVLHKQGLAEDAQGDDLVHVVKNIGALHAQVPTTPFLSLLNRLKRFKQEDLQQALYQAQTLVKVKCMRGTLFIVPRQDVVSAVVATRNQFLRRGSLLKQYGNLRRTFEQAHRDPSPFVVSEEDLDRLTEAVQDVLSKAEHGMTVEEIKRALETRVNISYLISSLCDEGILARGATGQWTTARHRYVLWKHWLPDVKLEMDEATARALLIATYLAAFGPVTENDVSWWTGLGKTVVRKTLKAMEAETTQIGIEGLEGAFVVLKSDLAGLGSMPCTAPCVRLLPRFDAYVVGYKDRRRLIDPAHQEKVFWRRRGEIAASILAHGRLIGTWTHKRDRKSLAITFSLFEEADKCTVDRIVAEAQRVGAFIGGEAIRVCQT